MYRWKRLLSIVIVLWVMVYSDVSRGIGVENMRITNNHAIEIANKEAVRLGYDPQFMNMEVMLYNTPWNKLLPQEPQGSISEYDPERNEFLPQTSISEYNQEHQDILNILKGREYWAISYSPISIIEEGSVKGGGIDIFIDSKTGGILTWHGSE